MKSVNNLIQKLLRKDHMEESNTTVWETSVHELMMIYYDEVRNLIELVKKLHLPVNEQDIPNYYLWYDVRYALFQNIIVEAIAEDLLSEGSRNVRYLVLEGYDERSYIRVYPPKDSPNYGKRYAFISFAVLEADGFSLFQIECIDLDDNSSNDDDFILIPVRGAYFTYEYQSGDSYSSCDRIVLKS